MEILAREDVKFYMRKRERLIRNNTQYRTHLKNLATLSFHTIMACYNAEMIRTTENHFGIKKDHLIVLLACYNFMLMWNYKRYLPKTPVYGLVLKEQMSKTVFNKRLNHLISEGYLFTVRTKTFGPIEANLLKVLKRGIGRTMLLQMDGRIDAISDYYQKRINTRIGHDLKAFGVWQFNFKRAEDLIKLRHEIVKNHVSETRAQS